MPKLTNISFFCPAYNEEKNLPEFIPKVIKFLSSITNEFEIIIIENGSTDKTYQIAQRLEEKFPQVKIIHNPIHLDYGAALKKGFAAAQYDYISYSDSDNQYDISELAPHLHLLDKFDVLSGYAVKKAASFSRKIQSDAYNFLLRFLFGIKLKDINCSMKVYKRAVLNKIEIKSDSAFIDAEMLIKAQQLGYRIIQFPVTHYFRKKGLATGSDPKVILATIKEMIKFKLGIF